MKRKFLLLGIGILLLGGGAALLPLRPRPKEDAETTALKVHAFCVSCHAFPPPDTLPRDGWKEKITTMYGLIDPPVGGTPGAAPPLEDTLRYYVDRAPERLPPSPSTAGIGPGSFHSSRLSLKLAGIPSFPGTANVKFVKLFDESRLDLLISEMRFGMVLACQPYLEAQTVTLLGRVPHPCHAEVVDLDRNGVKDILVADLGTVTPSDATNGSIVWLRGAGDRKFETVSLASGLGRVADAQAADFDGDGDMDVVAAVFGWRKVGSILLLENRTEPGGQPTFVQRILDPRPGAIHVPIVDLNGDGLPDFVALLSQHYETVVAFLNQGGGWFEQKSIFTAPHPNWGSSGIEMVDMDRDGDLDVLFTNGDTLDDLVLKPWHGIAWLENKGGFPFEHHRITDLHGVYRAKTGDLDGDGDLDIAACTFIPFLKKDSPGVDLAESIIWLEQTAPGQFARHSIATRQCTHPTLDVGDYDADGDADIAVGNMTMAKGEKDTLEEWVILFRNLKR